MLQHQPDHDHLVQFYDTDEELLNSVIPYLAEGLGAGENVVVIATEAHREAFQAALDATQMSAAGDGGGEYLALDAAEALARLRPDGVLEQDAFDGSIGVLVRDRLATGRPLRAYGEIVTLLWNEGDPSGAIELEAMWNRLQSEHSFTLFCGYPSPPSELQHAALPQVCAEHSCVVPSLVPGGEEPLTVLDAELPAELGSPRVVRKLIRSSLEELQLDDDVIDRGILTASELASNAVLHARTAFRLLVQPHSSSIWIGVQDRSPLKNRLQVVGRSRHGLGIIAALALRWGVKPSESGKLVWAELPR
jgi:hypothetical protein